MRAKVLRADRTYGVPLVQLGRHDLFPPHASSPSICCFYQQHCHYQLLYTIPCPLLSILSHTGHGDDPLAVYSLPGYEKYHGDQAVDA
jgi:hypothetical protein